MKRSTAPGLGMALCALVLLGFASVSLAEDGMPMKPPQKQQQPMAGGGMAMEPMEPMDMNEMGGMGGMKGGAMEPPPMEMEMMGMMDGSAAMQSPLPGFPGASHLYHVGSTGFFLDHAAMIGLSVEQKRRLGQIREQSQMEGATLDRRILQTEQELWQLTAAEEPDAAAIEEKVREIETSRGDKRMAFIRAVGRAAEVLTPAQRQKALGMTGK